MGQAIHPHSRDAVWDAICRSQAVIEFAPDGTILLDTDNGAFIAVVGDALNRQRVVHRISGNPPVTLARLANGRLVLSDPATGWSAELTSFGAGNARHWEVLFGDAPGSSQGGE